MMIDPALARAHAEVVAPFLRPTVTIYDLQITFSTTAWPSVNTLSLFTDTWDGIVPARPFYVHWSQAEPVAPTPAERAEGDCIGGFLTFDGEPIDTVEDGCWADVWRGGDVDDEDGDYYPCNAEPTDDLGLCQQHATKFTDQ